MEASCWASKRFSCIQTKWELQHATRFGCKFRVKVICTHPVPAAVSSGLPKCWSSLPTVPSSSGVLTTDDVQDSSGWPAELSVPSAIRVVQTSFFSFLFEGSRWHKHLPLLFIWIADPFKCWLPCGLNTTVDALLKHERTMRWFHSQASARSIW